MGCDHWNVDVPDVMSQVSIHAPAWGATVIAEGKHAIRVVSIHAPAWGATLSRSVPRFSAPRFNPRTRMGCDIGLWSTIVADIVSIHAPAWGAT